MNGTGDHKPTFYSSKVNYQVEKYFKPSNYSKQILFSYTDCLHYTNLLLFSPIHLYHVPVPHPFFILSCICFPVFSSPRNFLSYLITFSSENHHHPVSPLPGPPLSISLIHFSYWWLVAAPRRVAPSPSPVYHWPPVVTTVFALSHCFQTTAASMEWRLDHARTSGSKQEPALYDHCFMATDHRIKE